MGHLQRSICAALSSFYHLCPLNCLPILVLLFQTLPLVPPAASELAAVVPSLAAFRQLSANDVTEIAGLGSQTATSLLDWLQQERHQLLLDQLVRLCPHLATGWREGSKEAGR